tara:strand:+ start:336 stop:608 length:273 start_codon:yes stop_codon:yes gene_type:complete
MNKEKVVKSLDGRAYSPEVEADLNSKANALFNEGIGKSFLQYLENITTNNVHGAGLGIETLAHFEGQRWIVALIKARCEIGRKQGEIRKE